MKIEYDREADALYIYIQPNKYVAKSKELEGGVVIDLDKAGKAIGLEIFDISKKYQRTNVCNLQIRELITSQSLSKV